MTTDASIGDSSLQSEPFHFRRHWMMKSVQCGAHFLNHAPLKRRDGFRCAASRSNGLALLALFSDSQVLIETPSHLFSSAHWVTASIGQLWKPCLPCASVRVADGNEVQDEEDLPESSG